MKVTLRLCDGRELTFEEVENISVLNECSESKCAEVADRPTEGKWFKVNPLAIDQNLFKERREDLRQEATRKLILEAFAEMKKNPRYERPFKTMMPEKIWQRKTVGELKELASQLGDHNANWVEQVLEWAQRIANGETWEAVCNERDTAKWYRLVVWNNGYARLVGGSHLEDNLLPASVVLSFNYDDSDSIFGVVPLVVFYE